MRRELKAVIHNLRLAQEHDVADFIEQEGYIPNEDELEMLIGEDEILAMDTTGLPIAYSDEIHLTEAQLEKIPEELIDGNEIIVDREGKIAKAKIVFVDTAKISSEIKEFHRSLIADLQEQLEETGADDIETFLTPESEVYELDLTCPNCGDHECFPSFTEEGLQHYTCNQCGADFVSVEEPEPIVETETVPLDEFAEVELEHEGAITRWALSVDDEIVDEGEVEGEYEAQIEPDEGDYHYLEDDFTEINDEEGFEEATAAYHQVVAANERNIEARRIEAIKQAHLAYYRRFVAFQNAHLAGEEFMTGEGKLLTLYAVNDDSYTFKDENGFPEEIPHEELEDLIACGEFEKISEDADETIIDDIQEGDEFDDGEGRILVESRTRNEIFGIYTPYNEVRTAAEEVFVENAYDFCRRVKGLKKL